MGNPILASLDGLEAMPTIRDLRINWNDSLTSLSALQGLTLVNDIRIRDNPILKPCEAQALIAEVDTITRSATESRNGGEGTCD